MHIINGNEYHELNLLAEGGYGYVWRAIAAKTKKLCIIKKIICQDEDALNQAQNEIKLHYGLNHPNIVKVIDYCVKQDHSKTEVLIVMEICEGGTLFELMYRYKDKRLNESQIILVMKQIVQGVKFLHSQNPPIQHRDLKVENILLHQKQFKICDFGSASTQKIDLRQPYYFISLVSNKELSKYEEQFSKYTTEMYRPPEMTDIYQRFEVSEKVDIWQLGCILYSLCFYVSPFQEVSKLAIVEAAYSIPQGCHYSQKILDLIKLLLTPNPKERPNIFQVEELVENFHKIGQIQLDQNDKDNKSDKADKDDGFDDFQTGISQNLL
ncbi:BMP-2-inducible protein kinase [Paramecium bursaria]